MSVTLAIDEELLRAAEKVTNIHDWPTLVEKGLQALCENGGSTRSAAQPFDFAAALAAAELLPDLTDAELDRFERELNRPLPPSWPDASDRG